MIDFEEPAPNELADSCKELSVSALFVSVFLFTLLESALPIDAFRFLAIDHFLVHTESLISDLLIFILYVLTHGFLFQSRVKLE